MNTVPEGYLKDGKGRLVPQDMVKPHELLEDDTVRRIIGFSTELSAQIARFKGHTFEDVGTFLDILREKHNQTKRGAEGKGNITLSTFDQLMRVQVRVQDHFSFGPGLQVAKEGIDDCLNEWSADSRPEIRELIQEAFKTDKEGEVSREAVFHLLRLNIDDPKWQAAMELLRESIRVEGSKTYLRIQTRKPGGKWETLSIDLASAEIPEVPAEGSE
tara:strand:+ start:7373 stop:8020 length:648 start_codon:yes stop_codon:yes gene_type:complete